MQEGQEHCQLQIQMLRRNEGIFPQPKMKKNLRLATLVCNHQFEKASQSSLKREMGEMTEVFRRRGKKVNEVTKLSLSVQEGS